MKATGRFAMWPVNLIGGENAVDRIYCSEYRCRHEPDQTTMLAAKHG